MDTDEYRVLRKVLEDFGRCDDIIKRLDDEQNEKD